jgi:hypothetical protein
MKLTLLDIFTSKLNVVAILKCYIYNFVMQIQF